VLHTKLENYKILTNGKGVHIAKQLVLAKLEGQNSILRKHGFPPHDDKYRLLIESMEFDNLETARNRLNSIEGKFSEAYFRQVLRLLPEKLRPDGRKTFKAFDGVNNIFNLAYEVLSWKVHRAVVRAKLEPYLGFLHSLQEGKPSLVCDFEELYRYLIDDFVIQYCQNLRKRDFTLKTESLSRKKVGKREYLNDVDTKGLMRALKQYFESMVEIPRIRVGTKQTIETLISEEALLLAKFLRREGAQWIPRMVAVD